MSTETIEESAEGLRKGLKNRHIQMIALGGAIGTGLFYGSAEGIQLAGPSILIAYAIGGAAIFLVVRALGEMVVHRPASGAFSRYANDYWSPRAGFVAGWSYWFLYIFVSMSELVVVGKYIQYWWPSVPEWVSALVFLILITSANLVGVKAFGEFEFWFAMIKVVAVIGMIVLGTYLIISGTSTGSGPAPAWSHLFDDGFMPFGINGLLMCLAVVMFSFGGMELVGIAAGETEDPERTIPKAINQLVYRILIFYIGALAVVMSVIPWRDINGKSSPFVQIFDSVGITAAAHILNIVVLTAALSVFNSGLYSNGRMLYTLARQGSAPRFLGRLSAQRVPRNGILLSSGIIGVVVVVVLFFSRDTAFSFFMSTTLASVIITWAMILITHSKFRRHLGPDKVAKLSFKLPGGLVSSVVAMAFFVLVVVMMWRNPNYRLAVIILPIWLTVLLIGYELKTRVLQSGTGGAPHSDAGGARVDSHAAGGHAVPEADAAITGDGAVPGDGDTQRFAPKR
ncbi:MAG: amino acid permease [Actinomycetaceae bacterium]|nr:amino acid permease [Actinomycetaceae bacterium]